MATTPYLVSGVIRNSFGDLISNSRVTFVISGTSNFVISDSFGKYIIDLDNIGYSVGDTVSYYAIDEHSNEVYTGSFVISGSEKTLNISLSVRSNRIAGDGNRDVSVTNIGGKTVSSTNPFPVTNSNIPLGKGSFVLSYDASNNLTKVVKTLGSDTYTLTLGYDGSNNLTTVSTWVKS